MLNDCSRWQLQRSVISDDCDASDADQTLAEDELLASSVTFFFRGGGREGSSNEIATKIAMARLD